MPNENYGVGSSIAKMGSLSQFDTSILPPPPKAPLPMLLDEVSPPPPPIPTQLPVISLNSQNNKDNLPTVYFTTTPVVVAGLYASTSSTAIPTVTLSATTTPSTSNRFSYNNNNFPSISLTTSNKKQFDKTLKGGRNLRNPINSTNKTNVNKLRAAPTPTVNMNLIMVIILLKIWNFFINKSDLDCIFDYQ